MMTEEQRMGELVQLEKTEEELLGEIKKTEEMESQLTKMMAEEKEMLGGVVGGVEISEAEMIMI